MKVLIVPDKFKGTATAREVTEAIAEVFSRSFEVETQPMADGGDGTLEVFGGGNRKSIVSGPLNKPVEASWRFEGTSAVIEMAQASGLHLIGGKENNDPVNASTNGTGELIAKAIERGAEEILIGLGGSATTDGGFGALEALKPLSRLHGVELNVACDVTTGFLEAAETFGPQKGATSTQVKFLQKRLERLAQIYYEERKVDVTKLAMAGAAGGLAGGLASVGANLINGFEAVAENVGLLELVEEADLVVTGEGEVNESSFNGKVVGGVLQLARETNTEAIVIAGQVSGNVDRSIPIFTLIECAGKELAYADTRQAIKKTAEKAVCDWA
ncbi:MAG: glycerate kinase [Acidimicrobiales bacterium]|jgi:glycerate kinase|nr:glycerate kinase [Acidimicrobiales bacterium]MDP6299282.1 glycerate kinase [Acidimicrobiales bacterium]HJM28656.1 glycerate kinase [Acidimicrobiales bacterium]HJM97948.1 glycerate kinase [Acidimicrobiales bacterium]